VEYIVAGNILLKSDCQMGACSGAVGIIPFNCRMDSGDGVSRRRVVDVRNPRDEWPRSSQRRGES
jgi:hypothetical protein